MIFRRNEWVQSEDRVPGKSSSVLCGGDDKLLEGKGHSCTVNQDSVPGCLLELPPEEQMRSLKGEDSNNL